MTRSASDRGTWLVVARREFVERIRDRGFQVSTAITLLILIVVIVINMLVTGPTRFDLAVVGEGSADVGGAARITAGTLDVEVALRSFEDVSAANAAVAQGAVDAAIVDAGRIVVKAEPPAELVGVIQAVSARLRSGETLADAGLSPSEIRDALTQPPLPVRSLEPFDDERQEAAGVAFVGVLALYGQLFAYGYWVAAGVVEEKSSRVVEVLLATVTPSQLLRGKILGIGVLGLLQLLLIGVVGLTVTRIAGTLEFPSDALRTVAIVLVWFVLGFFFYAGLFAVAGALVSRQEDLQTTMTPLTIVIVGSFFIGISAVESPDSTLATVASLLPPSAPLVMPSRVVLGETGLLGALASAAISIATTVALVPLATRVYSGAVLRTGKVKIRAALGRAAT
jgi:ABC-2 type transport system permease protein